MQISFTLDEMILFIKTDYRDYRISELNVHTPEKIAIVDKLIAHWLFRFKYGHFEYVCRDLYNLYGFEFPELYPFSEEKLNDL